MLCEKSSCCGCGACEQACPKHSIAMKADEEGFLYPFVDTQSCVMCGLCENVCPVLTGNPMDTSIDAPQAFAVYSKNEKWRSESSSGGVFSEIAEQILKNNGVVFGAAMTKDCCAVNHVAAETITGVAELRGSKYLQSNLGKTYQQAQAQLEKGRQVLFSGTPCEIEGLKAFLHKDYRNLLCVDLICHGAPSPQLWKKYVRYRENRAGAPARRTFFRHKKYGWKTYAVLFEFSNNTAYEQILSKDLFMQMFLQNICLRPSCYDCKFKKVNRVSDITLADFWGCGSVCPDMDDDKGLSLVLVHSEKGKALLKSISGNTVQRKVDFREAIKGNTALTCSVAMNPKREAFMRDMDALTIEELAEKYLQRPSLIVRLKGLIPGRVKETIKRRLFSRKQN